MNAIKRIFRIISENIIVQNQAGVTFDTNNTIMSFNIRVDKTSDNKNNWNYRRNAIIQMIEDTKPAIICMQEVMPHMFKYLKKNLSKTYDFVSTDRNKNKPLDQSLHWFGGGLCIFYDKSRYSFVNYRVVDFPISKNSESTKKNFIQLHLIDRVDETVTTVINTHLDVKSKEIRTQSINKILPNINRGTYLCGDFNCYQSSSEFVPLLKYNISVNLLPEQRTFNHFDDTDEILDFIITPNKINYYHVVTEDYGVPYISDHYPIIINLAEH